MTTLTSQRIKCPYCRRNTAGINYVVAKWQCFNCGLGNDIDLVKWQCSHCPSDELVLLDDGGREDGTAIVCPLCGRGS